MVRIFAGAPNQSRAEWYPATWYPVRQGIPADTSGGPRAAQAPARMWPMIRPLPCMCLLIGALVSTLGIVLATLRFVKTGSPVPRSTGACLSFVCLFRVCAHVARARARSWVCMCACVPTCMHVRCSCAVGACGACSSTQACVCGPRVTTRRTLAEEHCPWAALRRRSEWRGPRHGCHSNPKSRCVVAGGHRLWASDAVLRLDGSKAAPPASECHA